MQDVMSSKSNLDENALTMSIADSLDIKTIKLFTEFNFGLHNFEFKSH